MDAYFDESRGTGRSLAIIIPYLNERLTVGDTAVDFAKHFPESLILLVDNGSSDESSIVAQEALLEASFTNFRIVHVPTRGKGRALKRAFEEAEADYVIIVDADLTYAASDAVRLFVEALSSGYDMVVGARFSSAARWLFPGRPISGSFAEEPDRRPFHGLGNVLINSLVSLLSHNQRGNLADVMSGLRVVRRPLYKSYPCDVKGFEVETDLTLFALNRDFSLLEIGIQLKNRPDGSKSKLKTFTDGFRILRLIHRATRNGRPLFYFGILGLCFGTLAGAFGTYVTADFLQDGLIDAIPSAVLAASLGVLSGLAFMSGFIIDAVKSSVRDSN